MRFHALMVATAVVRNITRPEVAVRIDGRMKLQHNAIYGSDVQFVANLMSISDTLKAWAKQIKRDGVTLWFASRHTRTPWHAKALGVFVVAYALSPIDLIPDFIPVLGYVDDVLLLPSLIWLAIRLVPPEVLVECRGQADEWMQTMGSKPSSRAGAVLIVVLWLTLGVMTWFWLKSRP